MAHMLIDSMTAEFHPEKYRDDYRVALDQIIQGKVEGGVTTARPSGPTAKPEVIDLMERLRQSIEKQKSDRSAGARQEVRIGPPAQETAARRRARPSSGHLDLGEIEKIQAPVPALAAQRKSKSRSAPKEEDKGEPKDEAPEPAAPRAIRSRSKKSGS
jgi:DNA end-binding protein Ku